MTTVPRVTQAERDAIAAVIAKHPERPLAEIARAAHRSITLVWQIYRAELAAGRADRRDTGRHVRGGNNAAPRP
jgi:hypothetical protein